MDPRSRREGGTHFFALAFATALMDICLIDGGVGLFDKEGRSVAGVPCDMVCNTSEKSIVRRH